MFRSAALGSLTVALVACGMTSSADTLFELHSPRDTGIRFANTLQEDDSLYNPTHFDYIYNGAGVSVGDFNNDGKPDLYFAGNMVSGKLYLNRGEMEFRDVTQPAGLETHVWGTGVATVDINQDGLLDIYLSVAGLVEGEARANLLFVNTGIDADGVPHFEERAKEYGIADTGYSTQGAFFDYDRDGDLDLYVLTNAREEFNRNLIRPRMVNGGAASTDRLYRNEGNGHFRNVSDEAGILSEGYGLGVAISDLNQDGWPDVYVSNDFLSNDLVWINNQDGTFTDRAAEYLKHQAHNAMGNDVADFNNDALPDIMVVDMLPPDNLRQKLMAGGSSYDKFHMALRLGYEPQYVRNVLQMNVGKGADGNPTFSDVGEMAGVFATDWSWAPLLADFDNDGMKDLFVSNGYRRDVTNLDYISYSQDLMGPTKPDERKALQLDAMRELPEVKLHNYVFRNNGDLTFTDESEKWGMQDTNFSNGAAYVDLDGDGDLDLVVSNLNAPVSVYENHAERLPAHNYLRVELKGAQGNRGGYGAKVVARARGLKQYLEYSPYRGYKSTVEGALHFGLGSVRTVDSLEVYWPDGAYQLLTRVPANSTITLDRRNAGNPPPPSAPARDEMLRALPGGGGIAYLHRPNTLTDFKFTPLLPRKHSQEGPGIAVGDLDGNGLDDVFVGADRDEPRALFFQTAPGRFQKREMAGDAAHEDLGALIFDADGDGHPDLYVVSGGSYPSAAQDFYQDRLYLNDGRGGLKRDTAALPRETASGSSVVASDYDGDGDLDLFVGGRIVPASYPLPARSFLLRNDSKPGSPRFTDVTRAAAPGLEKPGLVTSALWTDFDSDGRTDLIVTGEWMAIRFFRNVGGRFSDVTDSTGLGDTRGWWNSLAAGDLDNDGDIDYVAGNLGLNSRYRATPKEPVRVYAADFDENGSVDPILTHYIDGKSYPVAPLEVMIDQILAMKSRFSRYTDYAQATIDQTLSQEEQKKAYVAESVQFASGFIENRGGGKFAFHPFPNAAQVAPAYGMMVDDCNGDGFLDVMMVGNSYAPEPQLGWYDAGVGNVLLGDGQGGFRSVGGRESGLFVSGDAKALASVKLGDSRSMLLVSQNGDSLKTFVPAAASGAPAIRLKPLDSFAVFTLANGGTRRQEFAYGSTYLSQSSRYVDVPANARSIVIHDSRGVSRTLEPRAPSTHATR